MDLSRLIILVLGFTPLLIMLIVFQIQKRALRARTKEEWQARYDLWLEGRIFIRQKRASLILTGIKRMKILLLIGMIFSAIFFNSAPIYFLLRRPLTLRLSGPLMMWIAFVFGGFAFLYMYLRIELDQFELIAKEHDDSERDPGCKAI